MPWSGGTLHGSDTGKMVLIVFPEDAHKVKIMKDQISQVRKAVGKVLDHRVNKIVYSNWTEEKIICPCEYSKIKIKKNIKKGIWKITGGLRK